MSLPAFAKAMERIVAGKDLETVKCEGMKLIVAELGAGLPGYMVHIEKFLKRLDELSAVRQSKIRRVPL